MGNFFKNKEALNKAILTKPDFLAEGKTKARLKDIFYIEETERKREEGVSMVWTVVESDNPKLKAGVDYCVLFFLAHYGLENYRKFCKEAILACPDIIEAVQDDVAKIMAKTHKIKNYEISEESLKVPEILSYFFEGAGKEVIVGACCDIVGTGKLSKEKKVPITTFRYSPFYLEQEQE